MLVHRSTSAPQVAVSAVGPGDGELLAAMATEVRTGGECSGVSLAAVLTREALQRLAGAASFDRGEGYASDGAVLATAEDDDGALTGKVRGSRIYRVRLWVQDATLAFSCTCPVGAARSFCKHCVAVGLIWLAGEDDPGAGAPAARALMTPLTPSTSTDPPSPSGLPPRSCSNGWNRPRTNWPAYGRTTSGSACSSGSLQPECRRPRSQRCRRCSRRLSRRLPSTQAPP
jgi:hypothetical protein